jgi:hypothetical protein
MFCPETTGGLQSSHRRGGRVGRPTPVSHAALKGTVSAVEDLDPTPSVFNEQVTAYLTTHSLIEPGLRPASPENGTIRDISQRLSLYSVLMLGNLEHRDGTPKYKARCWHAFLVL